MYVLWSFIYIAWLHFRFRSAIQNIVLNSYHLLSYEWVTSERKILTERVEMMFDELRWFCKLIMFYVTILQPQHYVSTNNILLVSHTIFKTWASPRWRHLIVVFYVCCSFIQLSCLLIITLLKIGKSPFIKGLHERIYKYHGDLIFKNNIHVTEINTL